MAFVKETSKQIDRTFRIFVMSLEASNSNRNENRKVVHFNRLAPFSANNYDKQELQNVNAGKTDSFLKNSWKLMNAHEFVLLLLAVPLLHLGLPLLLILVEIGGLFDVWVCFPSFDCRFHHYSFYMCDENLLEAITYLPCSFALPRNILWNITSFSRCVTSS